MKKAFKISVIGLALLGTISAPITTFLTGCTSNSKTSTDNNNDDINDEQNDIFNPQIPTNEPTTIIKKIQIKKIREAIDAVFSKITVCVDENNLEQVLVNSKDSLKQTLNSILSDSEIIVNKDEPISLWNKSNFNDQGYQNLNILIKLESDILPSIDANDYNIQVVEKENYYYLLVKNVITGFNQNENGVEEPEIPSNSLSDNQLGNIRTIINRYFNPITIKITPQNINSVLNEKQVELKTELQAILEQTNISIIDEQSYLVLVEGESKIDDYGYQNLSIGIKLKGNDIPLYNANNKYHVSIENNNGLIMVLTNIPTNYKQAIINYIVNQAQIEKLATTINSYFNNITEAINTKNINEITTNKEPFKNEINDILNESNISVSENDNIFKLLNSNWRYNDDGFQIIDISFELACGGIIKYPIDNPQQINFDSNDNSCFLSIKNVKTGYQNPHHSLSLTNEQLTNVNVTLNKYLNPINVDVNQDQINTILANKHNDLKNEINEILTTSNILVTTSNNFLIMWDGNDSKAFNSNGYLTFKIGVCLNVINCPQYDLHNNANVTIQNLNNKWYLVSKVTTNYRLSIVFNIVSQEQISNLANVINNYFKAITNMINETNVNEITTNKDYLRNNINEILKTSNISVVNGSNIFKLLDNELRYKDDDGFQMLNVGLQLNCDGIIQYPTNNPERLYFKKEGDSYFLTIKNIITSYRNPYHRFKLSNEQLASIRVTLDKYFNPINTNVYANQINQILGNKQNELKTELDNILSISSIPAINNNDFLVMWDNNTSKEYDNDGFLSFRVGINLDVVNCPLYDLNNEANISIEKLNDKWYVIAKVATNFQKIVYLNRDHAKKIKSVLQKAFNSSITNEKALNVAKITTTNEINKIVNDLEIQVKSLDYEIITQSPVVVNIKITFDFKIYLKKDVYDFTKIDDNTIKFNATLKTNYFQFVNNTDEYFKKIKRTNRTILDAREMYQEKCLPYEKVVWENPNEYIYDEAFENINSWIIENDFLCWLKDNVFSNNHLVIKMHINQLSVWANYQTCNIIFKAQLYNNSLSNKNFTFHVANNPDKIITIKPNETIDFNINVDHLYHRSFKVNNDKNKKNADVGYYIDNMSLNFSNHTSFKYEKFFFHEASKSINTRINIPNEVGYYDVADEGEKYLNSLNIDQIKSTIMNKSALNFNTFVEIINSFQWIISNFLEDYNPNRTITVDYFFEKSARYIEIIIDRLAMLYNKPLEGIGWVFYCFFRGYNLVQTLNQSNVKKWIYNIFHKWTNVLNFIYDNFFNEKKNGLSEKWYSFFDFIAKSKFIKQEIKDHLFKIKRIIELLSSKGMNIIVVKNLKQIIHFIRDEIIGANANSKVWRFIDFLADKYLKDRWTKGVSDILYEFIKIPIKYNGVSEPLIIHLLKTINAQNEVIDKINKYIIKNKRFNKMSIAKFLKIFSNMSETRDIEKYYIYSSFLRHDVHRTVEFKECYYNERIHNIRIKFIVTYTTKKTIYLHWKQGLRDIIENSDFEFLLNTLPEEIRFQPNTTFVKETNFSTKLNYALIKNEKGQYEMTWQLQRAQNKYKFLAPSALKYIFDNSYFALKRFYLYALNPILYGRHTKDKRYVADNLKIIKDHKIIENYNPYVPNDEYVIVNYLNNAQYDQISNHISRKCTLESDESLPKIKIHNYPIFENYTFKSNEINEEILKKNLFDLKYLKNTKDYKYSFNYNILLDETLGVVINIRYIVATITIWFKMPMCFYDKNHDKFIFTDHWTYHFSKFNVSFF